ncbi:MAG: rhodanese-like domain-containing protein [Lachnospiraceae bacterium]|nr:rhodanese-like domain-containing protein [Lachnospiraceae bacterium]
MRSYRKRKMTSREKIALITFLASLVTGLCAVFLLVRSVRPSAGKPYEMLEVTDARQFMSYEKNYMVIDVREPEQYSAGHLQRAVNIPFSELVKNAPVILRDSSQSVYVYGSTLEQSCAAAQKLSDMGYSGVAEIGSYADWQKDMSTTETESLMGATIE